MIQPGQAAPRSRLPDAWAIAGLVLLAVVLPLVAGAFAGALEIPRNDDWSYRRIAIGLARTGQFTLDGISETMLIGQVLVAQPFLWLIGLQPAAFTTAGVVFATAGIIGAYALARQILPPRYAVIAAGLLAVFPGYLAYATSFMSDVPALAAEFLCLALGMVAVRDRPVRLGWLLASAAMGIFAFSIREFAIAAPASVLAAAALAQPGRLRIWALGAGVAACCVGVHVWRASLPGQLPPLGDGLANFGRVPQAFSSVAFVVAPAALIGAVKWRHHVHRLDLLVGFGISLLLVAAPLLHWVDRGNFPVLLTNLTTQVGVPGNGNLAGGRPELFNDVVWAVVNLIALVATVVVFTMGAGLTGAHLRRCSSWQVAVGRVATPQGTLVLFVLAVTAGLMVFALTRPIYDRYFWPLVPPLAALFLFLPADLRVTGTRQLDEPPLTRARAPSDRPRLVLIGAGGLIAAALSVVSVTLLFNSMAFDAARWDAGERLVQAGLPADRIDAGFEWMGYHATTQGNPTNRTPSVPFYRRWWPSFVTCGLVTSRRQDLPDHELVGTTTYRLRLVQGPVKTLYLYRIDAPGCR